jgi:hypothetical protein
MGISDGRESESNSNSSFQFADWYSAINTTTLSGGTRAERTRGRGRGRETNSAQTAINKRESNHSRIYTRWSIATRLYARIRGTLERFRRGRSGRGTERGTAETLRKESIIVSHPNEKDKEKERWLSQK